VSAEPPMRRVSRGPLSPLRAMEVERMAAAASGVPEAAR